MCMFCSWTLVQGRRMMSSFRRHTPRQWRLLATLWAAWHRTKPNQPRVQQQCTLTLSHDTNSHVFDEEAFIDAEMSEKVVWASNRPSVLCICVPTKGEFCAWCTSRPHFVAGVPLVGSYSSSVFLHGAQKQSANRVRPLLLKSRVFALADCTMCWSREMLQQVNRVQCCQYNFVCITAVCYQCLVTVIINAVSIPCIFFISMQPPVMSCFVTDHLTSALSVVCYMQAQCHGQARCAL